MSSLTKRSLKVVYKNMWFRRPKFALGGLILLAVVTSLNAFFQLRHLSITLAIILLIFALTSWFVLLPIVIFFIDNKNDPERINTVIQTIPDFY